jgi:hypothetical protein
LQAVAEITILSHPLGADVIVDGELMGTTPLVLSDLEPGSHVVQIRLSGYDPYEETIVLEAGSSFDLSVDLTEGQRKLARAATGRPADGSFRETVYVVIAAVLLTLLVLWLLDRDQTEEENGGGGGKDPL